jgi:TonB-dependent SusC/RagA subfamily outer membrane receptor
MKIYFVLPVLAIAGLSFAEPEFNYSFYSADVPSFYRNPLFSTGEAKGIVLNEESKPMFAVSVTISGTYNGVFTDAEGRFAVANIPEGSSLVFSNNGYITLVLKPDFSREMTVRMARDLLSTAETYIQPEAHPGQAEAKTGIRFRNKYRQLQPAEPLIIVDGVIFSKGLESLNPNDISTISVLKNESATAVFGEKGKNGVIVIVTKNRAADHIK